MDTQEKIKAIAKDFYRYAENNLKILDKNGRIVTLVPNNIQKEIIDYCIECLETGKPIRIIVLKARQEGVSTIIEALIFWYTATHRNVHAKIIGHETDAALNLYQMFQRYYDNANPIFKPQTKYLTKNDLFFDNDEGTGIKSHISTSSAQNTETGRSQTIHWLHACLHEDSLVVLADGSSKRIADIEIGDKVFTGSGAIAPVSAKTLTGLKQTYKLNTWMTNEPIIASADHKILTIDGYKKLSELTSEDWIAKPKYKFEDRKTWEFNLATVRRPQGGGSVCEINRTFDLDEEFGYLVGYYLAEGHITKNRNRVTFTYATGEEYVKNVDHLFKHTPRYITEGNRSRAEFNDKFMANALYELCGRVESKHVPTFGNLEFYRGLYKGYMDGDGSKTDKTRQTAPSVHERIARNINRIGDLLGTHGSLQTYERERYGVASKQIWVNSFSKGTSKPHIRKYKFIDGQCFVRVKSIKEYEVADTYDLEIDHPDHNFETPSGVVSNSEVAFWRDGGRLVAGLMQTVPMLQNTAVFIESTANGVGDFFYKTWQAAKKGESPLKPFFFPWFIHEEYRIETKPLKDLTPEEKTWKREYKLEDSQILWYREKSKEFAHDPKKMNQEYPFNEQEAFLAAGRPRFNPYKLQAMEEKCYDPGRFELLEPGYNTQEAKFILKPIPGAPLKVWEQPQEGRKYVIGADVADVGEDKSVATIMDVERSKTVARWRGDIEPSEFGELLDQLGRYYNRALVGVEINNHGLTTVQRLRDLNYENLYRRERGKDERWEQYTSKLGWATNRQTKPLMIDALAEAINAGKIEDYDLEFVREGFTFVIDDRGKTEAQDGSHDDVVMSTAIALQLFDWNDIVLNRRRVPSYRPSNYAQRKRANKLNA